MMAKDMWQLYSAGENITADYEAWAFGDAADELARLTLAGIKTATASAHALYALSGEELPQAGEYSIILDSQGEAVCIIRTERVCTTPFDEVDENHAWKEGEGDRSLSYWRKVHRRFFRAELEAVGIAFDEKMLVVCEEFVQVYP